MLYFIRQLDESLFLTLNFDGGGFLDDFFWAVSGKLTWLPLYVLILAMLWRRYGWGYALLIIAFTALTVVAVDHVANFFKHVTPRPRPTHNPEFTDLVHTVRGYTGGKSGTVSAHAATTFVVMTSALTFIRTDWFTAVMTLWVALVAYSRIYLGVHYPADVLIGAIIGILAGLWMTHAFRWTAEKIQACQRLDRAAGERPDIIRNRELS